MGGCASVRPMWRYSDRMRMRSVAIVIVVAACGGAKGKTGERGTALRQAQEGSLDRRVLTYEQETIAAEAKDEDGAAPVAPSKDSVHGELVRHRGTLAACLVKDAAARGQLELVFGIAGSGAIGDVYVNGVGNDELHACLAAAVKTFAFAADPGGVLTEVHYPIAIGARATP